MNLITISKYLIATLLLVSGCLGFDGDTVKVSDGTLKLIIKSYINDLLSKHLIQDELMKRKLYHLSDHVTRHPALGQKHLYIGGSPPLHMPQSHSLYKRLRDDEIAEQLPSEEICSTNRQWEQINTTRDMDDNEVEVIQEGELTQFVYTYRCSDTNKAGSCVGISPLYHSECTERHGWVYMFYKKTNDPDSKPQWGYVAAPHHCACKIQPKIREATK